MNGVGVVLPFVVGLLLAALGNWMGKLRRNFWVGLRTPWTLASDVVWEPQPLVVLKTPGVASSPIHTPHPSRRSWSRNFSASGALRIRICLASHSRCFCARNATTPSSAVSVSRPP